MAALLRHTGCVALQLAVRQSGMTRKAPGLRFSLSAAALAASGNKNSFPVVFPQQELRKRLTPMQYHVTQERGTERAFTGGFADHKEKGTYTCVVCDAPLFQSDTKFDSGSGWPSFFDLIKEESVTVTDDFSYGMHRLETSCSQCGSHLGHLFDDGPPPTGKRYCINSASLAFHKQGAAGGPKGGGVGEDISMKVGGTVRNTPAGKTEL